MSTPVSFLPTPPVARPDGDVRKPRTPEEAARQFEEVLVRQLVQTMTKDLFQDQLSGEDGPGWMESHAQAQRDVLTDVLAQHLVEHDTLGIRNLLLRHWQTPPR
jgi:flagellar protein FlgJ